MKIEYHNLFTHFVFVTQNRIPLILEKNRERIEKYITGIVNNNHSKLYSIYANPEHAHILVSRSPVLSEEELATIVADSSASFINKNKLCIGSFSWQQSASANAPGGHHAHETQANPNHLHRNLQSKTACGQRRRPSLQTFSKELPTLDMIHPSRCHRIYCRRCPIH